ncbi:transcriptional regulator with XRE-family HTH domain [Kitasatospora sp. MAA4]|uniref:helix-turn-helix domain-containing protein n=1 Tax=Kitasatospora sp. MAA4 TaxID=3035093 RepID=UPI00247404A8|nr:Scr1 family TA system antitoxin-like transcriptional regulator [Kitasatospora sp. MAA4]MDH6135708.1 transcriptional regulator with XRE-family HTH domain [Kitasatospora sp. MAA4]
MPRRKLVPDPARSSAALWGRELAHWRRAAHMTQQQLAELVHCDQSWISALENGRAIPTKSFAQQCDDALGAGGVLARSYEYVERVGDDHAPDWFQRFRKLEAEAEEVLDWQPYRLSGWLQTEAYARALIDGFGAAPDAATAEEWVQARLARKAMIFAPDGPKIVSLLDESVIRRVVGSPQIQAEALRHLLELSTRKNVTIQILPMGADTTSAFGYLMTFLHLPNGQRWLYSETLTRGHFCGDGAELKQLRWHYDQLRAQALSAPASRRLIRRILEELINVAKPRNLASASWLKSSYSGGEGGNCIEVSTDFAATGAVPVRDSKDPHGPALILPTDSWSSFVTGIRNGDFGTL